MADTDSNADRKRKRPRAARACDLCRTKKYKCDEQEPCSHCRKQNIACKYQGAERVRDVVNMNTYVAELENRVRTLSNQLLEHQASQSPGQIPLGSIKTQASSSGAAIVSPAPTEGTQYQRGGIQSSGFVLTDRGDMGSREGAPTGTESGDDDDGEVNDLNPHTQNNEFHGPTSSMAFLAAIKTQQNKTPGLEPLNPMNGLDNASIVSTFHNNAFSPASPEQAQSSAFAAFEAERYHFRHAHHFLDGYFQNIHFVHPILDRTTFLTRCEDLWFGRSERQPRSFVALYYSVMSLGALVREWNTQDLDGLGRFQWSRRMFHYANSALNGLRPMNDLETVQCMIFMAKVCQNELNPNVAYMYLGFATRAALSAGFNRQPRRKTMSREELDGSDFITKTWWGLYSLEIELSFALGRPDSLGLDGYHNRGVAAITDSETAIISVMIPMAKIIREVSIFIYHSGSSVRDQTSKAFQLEQQLDSWVSSLPDKLRPRHGEAQNALQVMKDPEWARRQRIVLELRHLNVKMILFRPFLICATRNTRHGTTALDSAVTKCVHAARRTVELMHETFMKHAYFRTWWYNTTYVLYAASIILCYATRAATAPASEKSDLLGLIDMTLEVLTVMEENVVARKASVMVRQILSQIRTSPIPQERSQSINAYSPSQTAQIVDGTGGFDYDGLHIQMPDLSMDPDLDFINASLPLDHGQFPLWSNFADSLEEFRY